MFSETVLRHMYFWYLYTFIFGFMRVPHCADSDSVLLKKKLQFSILAHTNYNA